MNKPAHRSVHALATRGARELHGADARREAARLLRHVLHVSDAWLVAHADDPVDASDAARFHALIERRARGEPIAYLTGTRGFHDIELRITSDVLIPRPETELLVELALRRLPVNERCTIADLGTGSGAVALAIAHARPHAQVTAADASEAALAVARDNVRRLGLRNVTCIRGDWCAALGHARFDLIVANPPYIAEDDPHLQQGDLRFEPRAALVSGKDGLDAVRAIVRDAHARLRSGGWLLFEHGFDQGVAARELLASARYADVFTAHDLEGRDRASGGSAWHERALGPSIGHVIRWRQAPACPRPDAVKPI